MLNRRYLRVKVLQALYAWFQTGGVDLTLIEKNMLKSIQKVYDLYLYRIDLLLEILHAAQQSIEHNKTKRLRTEDDLNPNMRFVENRVLVMLQENAELKSALEKRKINWQNQFNDVKKVWRHIKGSDLYDKYMNGPEPDFKQDKKFVQRMFEQFIMDEEVFYNHLEEQSIYWYTDMEVADMNVSKTISTLKEDTKPYTEFLLSLFKDEEDDQKFVRELLKKVISFDKEYSDIIADKTKNWELDRIALIDVVLMKMALCELEHFSSIPVKVTLNEYIELSKNFSTPKSKNFINGILDKVVHEWKGSKRIQKSGRGLVE